MPAKRDVLAEIEGLRGRTTAVDDLDSGILKLLTITTSTEKLKDDGQGDELHAYYVVASIAECCSKIVRRQNQLACESATENTFRWRQITHLIQNSEIKRLSNSCFMFARGCQYAIARFINRAGPITREDSIKVTAAKERDLQSKLKALEEPRSNASDSGL